MKSALRFLLVVGCGLVTFMPPVATAASRYLAQADAGTHQEFDSTEAVTATAGYLFPAANADGVGSMNASAAANPGSLRASADATINVNSSALGSNGSVAVGQSRFILDDIVISPLPGTTPLPVVPLSLSMVLSGSLDTLASIGFPHIGSAGGSASISVSGVLAGVPFGGDRTKTTIASAADGSVTDSPISGTGILAGASSVLVTPDAMVSINSPFTLDLRLIAGASASYSYGGTTTASTAALGFAESAFDNTLTLGFNGQVFNLPAGYTANSIGGMIVNNRVVPEPSSATLLALGSLLSAVIGRRRKVFAGVA